MLFFQREARMRAMSGVVFWSDAFFCRDRDFRFAAESDPFPFAYPCFHRLGWQKAWFFQSRKKDGVRHRFADRCLTSLLLIGRVGIGSARFGRGSSLYWFVWRDFHPVFLLTGTTRNRKQKNPKTGNHLRETVIRQVGEASPFPLTNPLTKLKTGNRKPP